MTLYGSVLCPYSSRCRMQIYAKGINIEIIDISGRINDEEYSKINPIQKIPALTVGNQVIPDSATICDYIEEKFSNFPLLPKDAINRAIVRSITQISDQYILQPTITLSRNINPQVRTEQEIKKSVADIIKGLGWLQNYMDNNIFSTVDNPLSLSDCMLVPTLFTITMVTGLLKIDNPLKDFNIINSYWEIIQNNEFAGRILVEMTEAKHKYFKTD